MPAMLLLGGCSGLGHFFGDTEDPPGYNPNSVTGSSENLLRARGRSPATEAMLPQSGNVWPGPPQPLPTLSDVSHAGAGGADALGGATLPRGGSMSMGEQNDIRGGALSGGSSGGGIAAPINDPARQYEKSQGKAADASGSAGSGNIVIPNGDGTSTVISPDGSVKTVKGSPK